MSSKFEAFLRELTTFTTLEKQTLIAIYEEELEKCQDEEEAMRRVRRRIDFYLI